MESVSGMWIEDDRQRSLAREVEKKPDLNEADDGFTKDRKERKESQRSVLVNVADLNLCYLCGLLFKNPDQRERTKSKNVMVL